MTKLSKATTSTIPGTNTFHRHRQEFQERLPVVQRVQKDLRADIAELQDQEGWDDETAEGIKEWSDDTDTVWRILRVCCLFKIHYNTQQLIYLATPVRHRKDP